MRRLILTLAIVALLAGCSSSSGGAGASAADRSTTEVLPLDAILIDLFGTDDVVRYRWEIERSAEHLLIECMQDAGFQFVVPPPLPPEPTEADLESRAFAEAKGFGIIDSFRTWLEETDIEALQRDPNNEYLQTLSAAEIGRFLLTLEGEEPEPGRLAENTGCRGASGDEAYATWNAFLERLPNYPGIAEERDSHPNWLAARAEWRKCMVERGYDYAEPDAIRSDVELRMSESVQSVYPDGRLPLVFEDDRFVLDPVVEPLLDELYDFEVAAAVANHDCTEPLADRFDAVEREVQQGFVDRNQAAIDDLLSMAG